MQLLLLATRALGVNVHAETSGPALHAAHARLTLKPRQIAVRAAADMKIIPYVVLPAQLLQTALVTLPLCQATIEQDVTALVATGGRARIAALALSNTTRLRIAGRALMDLFNIRVVLLNALQRIVAITQSPSAVILVTAAFVNAAISGMA